MAMVCLSESISKHLRYKSMLPCLHDILSGDTRYNACQCIYTVNELILLKTYFIISSVILFR